MTWYDWASIPFLIGAAVSFVGMILSVIDMAKAAADKEQQK